MGKLGAHHKTTTQDKKFRKALHYCRMALEGKETASYDRLLTTMEHLDKENLQDLISFLMMDTVKDKCL